MPGEQPDALDPPWSGHAPAGWPRTPVAPTMRSCAARRSGAPPTLKEHTMASHEFEQFLGTWEHESKKTQQLLAALPKDKYDFRPDAKGRSLGELAWHLAELDGYISDGVANGKFDFDAKLPNLQRPRTVAELAPGFTRVHADAVARVKGLKPGALDAATAL